MPNHLARLAKKRLDEVHQEQHEAAKLAVETTPLTIPVGGKQMETAK